MSLWSSILDKLREMVNKVIGAKTVEQALRISPAVSNDMERSIKLWADIYKDNAPWLHEPNWNDNRRVASRGIAQQIASEKARMCLLEWKSEITEPTEKTMQETPENNVNFQALNNTIETQNSENAPFTATRAVFLNEQYQKLRKNFSEPLELGATVGGLAIKPFVTFGKQGEKTVAKEFEFSFPYGMSFIPISTDVTKMVTDALFVETKVEKGTGYHRLERHTLVGTTYTVTNMAFKSDIVSSNLDNQDLGRQIPLSEVPEWADLQEVTTLYGVSRPLFVYLRMPGANFIDANSPLGVSVFAKAVKLIKDADMIYSTLLWECEAGQMAIDVDRDALNTVKDEEGKTHTVMNQLQNRLYRPVDLGNEETYHPFAPALRDVSFLNVLNHILMNIEDATGLSRGTLSEANDIAKTATELKIMKQRSYQTNKQLQTAVEKAMKEVVEVMDIYCDLYQLAPKGEYQMSFEWDDSILTDKAEELNKQMILFDRGIVSDVELRMEAKGETEAQAIENLNKIAERNLQSAQNQIEE